MTTIDRRGFGLGAAALGGAAMLRGRFRPGQPRPRGAEDRQAPCRPGGEGALRGGHAVLRPREAARAFTEHTGVNVKYTYVPFANMREALAAEMVGGTGDLRRRRGDGQWGALAGQLMDPMDAAHRGQEDRPRPLSEGLPPARSGRWKAARPATAPCAAAVLTARTSSQSTTSPCRRHGTRWSRPARRSRRRRLAWPASPSPTARTTART